MQQIDLIIFLVLAVSFLCAYANGFTGEMLKIGALILSSIVGVASLSYTQDFWEDLIPFPAAARAVGVGVVSFVFFLFFRSLANSLKNLIRSGALKHLDSVLGGAFGLIRGFAYAVLFTVFLLLINPDKAEDLADDSVLFPHVLETAEVVKEYVSNLKVEDMQDAGEDIRDKMEDNREKIEDIVEEIQDKVD